MFPTTMSPGILLDYHWSARYNVASILPQALVQCCLLALLVEGDGKRRGHAEQDSYGHRANHCQAQLKQASFWARQIRDYFAGNTSPGYTASLGHRHWCWCYRKQVLHPAVDKNWRLCSTMYGNTWSVVSNNRYCKLWCNLWPRELQAPHNELRYYLRENQGKMNSLFSVDQDTGDVMLRQSLLDDSDDRYEVPCARVNRRFLHGKLYSQTYTTYD